MSLETYAGRWDGRISGTNSGSFRILLTPLPTGLVAEAILEDETYGSARLVGTGEVRNGRLDVTLVSDNPNDAVRFGTVTVSAEVNEQGELRGDWHTTEGTSGEIQATRPTAVEAAQPASLHTAAATEKRLRIPSCVVDIDTLKRILAAMQLGADEAARLHHTKQSPPRLSAERLSELYRVAIVLRGAQGELVLSADVQTLSPELLPKPLQSIEFETGFYYRVADGNPAPNRGTVVLDFKRPGAFDLSDPSGSPTPNNSSIVVYGSEPIWVAGVFERIRAILQQGAVRTGWLHGSRIYDVLAYFIGIPFALASEVVASSRIPSPPGVDARFFGIAVFAFGFLTAMYAFRLAFSGVRWLLPYIEFTGAPEPLHRRIRLALAAILIGAVGSLAAAAIWLLFD